MAGISILRMNAMSKALENKLRRELYRKFGYTLRKSRIRIGPDNYGEYAIIDPDRNWLIAGEKFDLSLDDVRRFVSELEEGRKE